MIKSLGNLYLNTFKGSNRLERIWKLAQVDFRKRYYNDRLGILWALINPLFQMGIYYIIFTKVFNSKQENFALFIFSGLLIWMSFSEATNKGMNVIGAKRYLIENVQFERIDLFISSTLSVFMGLSFNLLVYVIFSFLSGVYFTWHVIFFPIIFINVFIICIASSLFLSTMSGIIKDIKHIWSLIILAGFFGSGIFYPGERIIEAINGIQWINPFLGLIINTRNVLFHGTYPDFLLLTYSMIFSFILLLICWIFYRRFVHLTLENL